MAAYPRALAAFAWLVLSSCGGAPPSTQGPRSSDEATGQELAPAPITAESAQASGDVGHGAAAVPVTSADPQWGSPLAPVTIVEFGDFQCPFTGRVQPTLEKVRESYGPRQVRIVWKHLPLPFHRHAKPAHVASSTVFALGGSEAFWRFHDVLLANQSALEEDRFAEWSRQAGLDPARFQTAYTQALHAGDVDDDLAESKRLGVTGTPGFLINGVKVSGAQPFEKFKEVIDEQLAAARRLTESGVAAADVYLTLTDKNFEERPPQPAHRAEEPDLTVWKVPVLADDPQRGPKDALVTIVEWSDFQCPFCKRVEATLTRLLDDYPKEVRIVWKDNPLPFHPRALPAARLSRFVRAKRGDAGFWAIHGALFESQPKLEDGDLKLLVEELKLPWAEAERALGSDRFDAKLEESMELASDLQARGTPHFFINGVRLSGAQPYEKFQALVEEQLAVARRLVESGTARAKVYEAIMKAGKEPPPPERKQAAAPTPDAPYRGNPKAKVVLELWSDFQCPFCKRLGATIDEIEKQHGKQVKIVFRHLPLSFHRRAHLAAQAAEEVRAQLGNDAFWKYHDLLFEAQSEERGLERDNLVTLAGRLGADLTRFARALDDGRHVARVDADADAAEAAGITGTPGTLINGYYVSGAQPAAAFNKLIRRALGEVKAGKGNPQR